MNDIHNHSELIALMDYLVKHNVSHTAELSELSDQVKEHEEAYGLVLKAIKEYEIANKSLASALEKLRCV